MVQKREVFIGFGSNLSDRIKTIHGALSALSETLSPPSKVSSLYYSKALVLPGTPDQPSFINGVAKFDLDNSVENILEILLLTEEKMGRRRDREKKWHARTIDLDLLFAGSEIFENETVTVPHPELHKRDFVLAPLSEISPSFIHPVLMKDVSTLYKGLLASNAESYIQSRTSFSFP